MDNKTTEVATASSSTQKLGDFTKSPYDKEDLPIGENQRPSRPYTRRVKVIIGYSIKVGRLKTSLPANADIPLLQGRDSFISVDSLHSLRGPGGSGSCRRCLRTRRTWSAFLKTGACAFVLDF